MRHASAFCQLIISASTSIHEHIALVPGLDSETCTHDDLENGGTRIIAIEDSVRSWPLSMRVHPAVDGHAA
ncbi:hypothetical protein [Actinoplanes solisilvae]|uniref:hypothetical protein n=1 Tax=Actinoplanes solisilvae TaxID=2486853 RepID=UPI000FD8FE2B|nr:hypothetical protein [Actinoplanes solisilvae]